jgi:glutamyl-Q tRNA(Asp) synthetase
LTARAWLKSKKNSSWVNQHLPCTNAACAAFFIQKALMPPTAPYIGRFAPSPTGALHFGSLVAAVGSYCDARAAGGKWLVRIEDIDPPREIPGATAHILEQLRGYGFVWDDEVLYQHTRSAAYQSAIERLHDQQQIFWCTCSRRELSQHPSTLYPGNCRRHTTPKADAAIRLQVSPTTISFQDRVYGKQTENIADSVGDFILQRRDHLFAYQLAVVVDDAYQGITDIVRGVDLLDNTARQIFLQQQLSFSTPRYLHLPLARNLSGQKLSKQNLAEALPLPAHPSLIWDALQFLGQQPPDSLKNTTPQQLLEWGTQHWNPLQIPAIPL